jgi:hypothetical protein
MGRPRDYPSPATMARQDFPHSLLGAVPQAWKKKTQVLILGM